MTPLELLQLNAAKTLVQKYATDPSTMPAEQPDAAEVLEEGETMLVPFLNTSAEKIYVNPEMVILLEKDTDDDENTKITMVAMSVPPGMPPPAVVVTLQIDDVARALRMDITPGMRTEPLGQVTTTN